MAQNKNLQASHLNGRKLASFETVESRKAYATYLQHPSRHNAHNRTRNSHENSAVQNIHAFLVVSRRQVTFPKNRNR